MQTAYTIDSVITGVGNFGGTLSNIRPDNLLAAVIKAIITRNRSVDINSIEEVIALTANQSKR